MLTVARVLSSPVNLFVFLAAFVLLHALCVRGEADTAQEKTGEKENYGTVIGIDLGTTYSCVGVFKNGGVEIIANDQGNRITPSYVAFLPEGELVVGESAKGQHARNPMSTIFDAKRLIGRDFNDPTVQKDIKTYDFKVVEHDKKIKIKVQDRGKERMVTPEEVSSYVLRKMKDIAENFLGTNVTHAVVTVPAYFNDAQRQATKDAGTIAGLKVLRVINEPTAAAIAYGLDKKGKEMNILVFDLGGGTFDVSILTIDNGVFEVRATSGDTHLGGQDFDQKVMEWVMKQYALKNNVPTVKTTPEARSKLRAEVEKAKRQLSTNPKADILIENFHSKYGDLSISLSRAKFEELNHKLFMQTLLPVKGVLKDAEMSKSDIHEIVIVGGSTRIPKVRQLLQDFFDGKKLSMGINPDEAIAYGAAVQGGVLSGDSVLDSIVLLDVSSLSLGIETTGGVMSRLIPRQTTLPVKKTQVFSTAADNQRTVSIQIYEGERPLTKDNHKLGAFDLTEIPAAPRGSPQIEVTFDVDASGILTVTAKEKSTGKEESIKIEKQSRLSDKEIERMIQEGVERAEDDKITHERIESRNALEAYTYSLRTQIKEEGGKKLSDADKAKILEAVQTTIKWLDANKEAIKEDLDHQKDELEKIAKPILAAAFGQSGDSGDDSAKDDDEEEDDEKTEL